MLTLFLGAGFSKWAAGLPLASQLFDFEIKPFDAREIKKLSIIRQFKRIWDLENPNGLPEQFIAYAIADSQIKRAILLWYITRRLSDSYIWEEWHAGRWRRHVMMIDENRKNDRPGVIRARKFILQLIPHLAGIITTNYDLIVEYALGTKHFNYGMRGEVLSGRGAYPVSQWRNPVTLSGAISLAKLHGSISWGTNGQRFTDGRRGIYGDALIVAPTPEKIMLKELSYEWELGNRILNKSESILVFGFAFNPYDTAINNYLTQNSTTIKNVIIVDINQWHDRILSIWPNAKIHYLPPPPESEIEIMEWFKNLEQTLMALS